MSTGIGGSLVIRNGNHYGYNWKEAIQSVLPICDYFVILDAYSDKDDTYEECLKMAENNPKIDVIRGDWDSDIEPPGKEYWRLSRLTNQCLDVIREAGFPFMLYVQGDEAWHEDGFEQILRITSGKSVLGDGFSAIQQPFHHFVGNPHTVFPFVYDASIRLARTNTSWRADDDAWIMRPLRREDSIYAVAPAAHIFHYGKLGDRSLKLIKEKNFTQLFKEKGFPDKKVVEMMETTGVLDYAYLFSDAREKGLFQEFTGTHPAVMQEWLESHSQWWQEFTE